MIPQDAIDAAIRQSDKTIYCLYPPPNGPDTCTHTDCYYAQILRVAIPHLITDDVVAKVASGTMGQQLEIVDRFNRPLQQQYRDEIYAFVRAHLEAAFVEMAV
jgi:hypothetical protein